MDRNGDMYEKASCIYKSPHARVAWIEIVNVPCVHRPRWSPPARVAWIEIFSCKDLVWVKCVATREGGVDRNTACDPARQYVRVVATREGGVDRNQFVGGHGADVRPSPPARVAWIEMTGLLAKALWPTVATREGGVDRNVTRAEFDALRARSPPARVAWIETVSSALFRPLPNVIARKVWRR